MKRIAMFGGSFNPVHNAHIGLVLRMKEKFDLDLIYVIPTYSTPLKDNTPMISAQHRFRMCELAFKGYSDIIVSDIEIKREGKSFTADTLNELKLLHPDDEICLLTGADSYMQLERWYHPEVIFESAHILTVSRGEYDADILNAQKERYESFYDARISIVEDPIALISSTDVRNAIKENKEFTHLLPNKVSDYIKDNGLYSYESK